MVMPDLIVSNGRLTLATVTEVRYFPHLVRKYAHATDFSTFDIDLMKVMRIFISPSQGKFFRILYETAIENEFRNPVPDIILEYIEASKYVIYLSSENEYDVYLPSWPDKLMAECRSVTSKFLQEFKPRRLVRNTKCFLPLSRSDCEILAQLLVPQIQDYRNELLTIETAVPLNFMLLFDFDFYERILIVETPSGMFIRANTYTNFTEVLFNYI